MLVSRFHEGVLCSVVGHGSGVFVRVVLMGVQTCPSVVLWSPGLRVGGTPGCSPPAGAQTCWGPPSFCKGTAASGGVGTRGFFPRGALPGVVVSVAASKGLVLSLLFSPGLVFCTSRECFVFLRKRGTCDTEKNGANPISD